MSSKNYSLDYNYDFNNTSLNLESVYINFDSIFFEYNIENNEIYNKELDDENKKLIRPCDDIKSKQINLDVNSKINSIFKINKMPFNEEDINIIIQKKNICKEKEKTIILDKNDDCE